MKTQKKARRTNKPRTLHVALKTDLTLVTSKMNKSWKNLYNTLINYSWHTTPIPLHERSQQTVSNTYASLKKRINYGKLQVQSSA